MAERAAGLAGLDLSPDQGIEISFVGDRLMAEVNMDALGHKGTTDVITFAYLEDGELLPDEVAVELLICVDFAWREGLARAKSSYARELALYIVHGLLHSAGEDDLDAVSRRRMRRRERAVMGRLESEFDFATIFPGPRSGGRTDINGN